MSSRSTNDRARERIARVFTYLQELHRVRSPATVRLDRYPWRLPLRDLPEADTVALAPRVADAIGRRANADGDEIFLVRVARPAEEPCPEPPPLVREALAPGWDRPGARPRMRTNPPLVDADDAERLRQQHRRADAFEHWARERTRWADTQAPSALFLELFELWNGFEREGDALQLYLGDGILVAGDGEDEVRHPLILQRLELRFEPHIPAFTLRETEHSPILYAPLLRHLSVDGKSLLQLQREFSDEPCDPIGGAETDRFLQALVHTFWPSGAFCGAEPPAAPASAPQVYRQPTLFLGRRRQDLDGTIDRYKEALAHGEEPPASLMRVVGVTPESEGTGERDEEILLTQAANDEQRRVIRRLADTGAVLVQGPPGTGKSHTIANLIGHCLARGKSILVTSHSSKALRVVRDKVAEPLRSLCVSVLDSDHDNTRQLEESITGILDYLASTSAGELSAETRARGAEREALARRCRELEEALHAEVAREHGTIELDGERVATTEVARELVAARGQHDWLPGPLADRDEPPLDDDAIAELYRIGANIEPADEDASDLLVPDVARLPTPRQFAELCNARSRALGRDVEATRRFWSHDRQSADDIDDLDRRVEAAAAVIRDRRRWITECLVAARRGTDEAWRALVDLVERAGDRIPACQALVLEHRPQVHLSGSLERWQRAAAEMVAHAERGKKLGRMALLRRPDWQVLRDNARVGGRAPETLEELRAVHALFEIQTLRAALRQRWDQQMVPLGAPSSAVLGPEPEKAALPYVEPMASALAWPREHLAPCEQAFERAGLDFGGLLREAGGAGSPSREVDTLRRLFCDELPRVLSARRDYLAYLALTGRRDAWLGYLAELADSDAAGDRRLVGELSRTLERQARDAYERAWQRARRLGDRGPDIARRDALLARLEPHAPAWAEAIRRGEPPHDTGEIPGAGDAHAAWAYRRWAECLAGTTGADLGALQAELTETTARLQEATARHVEALAWEAQLGRIGLAEQQALAGWLTLHKKIGKGTGKNAARLKEEARDRLAECRRSVPVWIMPLSRVVESFDIATTRFDVVIIDEASQCDILGLLCFAMAREVAVVGDHEQVSPYAVGVPIEKVQALIDELLVDIPNRQLYDGKTSVYDLARQSFGGTIRLLEHFRSVPDIVEFSNRLCYGGEIRPLREASSARVGPPLVEHPVAGGVKDGKINREEADEIVALVRAMCELPEYAGCTIGVICMVGTEQALHVDALLRRHLPAAEYQRRRLLCGNASQFQGDERDVVVLSMVDSSQGGRRLPIKQRDEAKKAFNVAASRARDQLWVVHSLEPGRDLKARDLRLELIKHAAGGGQVAAAAAGREPSDVEEALAAALRPRGYKTALHGRVGDHVIDLVVEGADGRRAAVLCDGGRHVDLDALPATLRAQSVLARLGWPILRARASAILLDPGIAATDLCEQLRRAGVRPAPTRLASVSRPTLDLRRRVLERARQLRGTPRRRLRAVSNAD